MHRLFEALLDRKSVALTLYHLWILENLYDLAVTQFSRGEAHWPSSDQAKQVALPLAETFLCDLHTRAKPQFCILSLM
jgi:hypothetical protein